MSLRPATARAITSCAIVAFLSYQARDLLAAWMRSPFDRGGWVALGLWSAPLIAWRPSRRRELIDDVLLGAGLVASTLGTVGSLHVLHHVGLACALAAHAPAPPLPRLAWIATAPCWMPALGWIGSRGFPDHVLAARCVLAAVGAVVALQAIYRVRRSLGPSHTRVRTRSCPGSDALVTSLTGELER